MSITSVLQMSLLDKFPIYKIPRVDHFVLFLSKQLAQCQKVLFTIFKLKLDFLGFKFKDIHTADQDARYWFKVTLHVVQTNIFF